MHRVLASLAIAGLVLGALVAIAAGGPLLIAGVAVFGLVTCVFLFLTRELVPIVIGAVAALAFVLAIIGGVGGVSTDEGGVDATIDLALAGAFLIAGLSLATGGVLAAQWDDIDPDWVGWVGVGALVVATVLAFVFMDDLGGLGTWAFVVGLLLLVAIWPTVLLLRAPGHTHEHHSEATV